MEDTRLFLDLLSPELISHLETISDTHCVQSTLLCVGGAGAGSKPLVPNCETFASQFGR